MVKIAVRETPFYLFAILGGFIAAILVTLIVLLVWKKKKSKNVKGAIPIEKNEFTDIVALRERE